MPPVAWRPTACGCGCCCSRCAAQPGQPAPLAAQRGDTEAVAELLGSADKSGIMPNCDCWWWGLRCRVCAVDDTHRAGLTPAMYAAAHGHAEILRLSNAGADLNLRNAEGNSAAMHAAIPGDAQVLEMLIKAGADVGLANKDGWTAAPQPRNNQGHDVPATAGGGGG